MPIRPENRGRYPSEWPAISKRIREDRAKGRCECVGECGIAHGIGTTNGGRCLEENGKMAIFARGRIVLTVAHLDHTPENVDDSNLKAMCQACHLRYDGAARRARRAAGGIGGLFG